MIVHEETPQVAGEGQTAPSCCHYWIIETAQGPISRGECQICHEVRDFKNSVFDMERDSQDNKSRKGSDTNEKDPKPAEPQVTVELNQEPDMADPETEATVTEEKVGEFEVEEPEFAGVSED